MAVSPYAVNNNSGNPGAGVSGIPATGNRVLDAFGALTDIFTETTDAYFTFKERQENLKLLKENQEAPAVQTAVPGLPQPSGVSMASLNQIAIIGGGALAFALAVYLIAGRK